MRSAKQFADVFALGCKVFAASYITQGNTRGSLCVRPDPQGLFTKLIMSNANNVPVTYTSLSEYAKCPTEGPTACHQLCKASHYTFTCSCLPGFKLQSDKQSCLPEGLISHPQQLQCLYQTSLNYLNHVFFVRSGVSLWKTS